MARIAVGLFWAGAGLTALATLFYFASAFAGRAVQRAAATSAGTITLMDRQPPSPIWARLGSGTSLAAACLAAMLVARMIATSHPPYSNMFEYLTAFGAGVVIAAIIFE